MDVVKWRGVGVHSLGTSVWQGQLYLWRRRKGLDQTWRCRCISDSLIAYRLKNSPTKNDALHCSFLLTPWGNISALSSSAKQAWTAGTLKMWPKGSRNVGTNTLRFVKPLKSADIIYAAANDWIDSHQLELPVCKISHEPKNSWSENRSIAHSNALFGIRGVALSVIIIKG
jgi:hypothetical protein